MLLRGQNIYLRALEPTDVDLFTKIENDTSLWYASSANVPYSRAAIKSFIASTTYDIYADRQLRLVGCRASDDKPVAFADITDFNPRNSRAEVGIVVFPDSRRRGYATECISLLAEYARKRIHMHSLYAIVASGNEASEALFRKAGFTLAATLPEWLLDENGSFDDALIFQKLL